MAGYAFAGDNRLRIYEKRWRAQEREIGEARRIFALRLRGNLAQADLALSCAAYELPVFADFFR